MESNTNDMKIILKFIIPLVLLLSVIPASAQKSEVLEVIEQFKNKEGALHKTIDPAEYQISTENLKVKTSDMTADIGDTKLPSGVEKISALMFMGEKKENSLLKKKMEKALKGYEVLMEMKTGNGVSATLYSKSIEEGYISELVMYSPDLMNSIIFFQGRMQAEEVAEKLMSDGQIKIK